MKIKFKNLKLTINFNFLTRTYICPDLPKTLIFFLILGGNIDGVVSIIYYLC